MALGILFGGARESMQVLDQKRARARPVSVKSQAGGISATKVLVGGQKGLSWDWSSWHRGETAVLEEPGGGKCPAMRREGEDKASEGD